MFGAGSNLLGVGYLENWWKVLQMQCFALQGGTRRPMGSSPLVWAFSRAGPLIILVSTITLI